jgi:hypothetical protein
MTSQSFKHQDKFLKDKPLLSYCDLFENHGITPETIKNRDILEIFVESKIYLDGELISDYICKLKSGIYFYLSKEGNVANYKLRVYYTIEQKPDLNLLINSIKILCQKILREKHGRINYSTQYSLSLEYSTRNSLKSSSFSSIIGRFFIISLYS